MEPKKARSAAEATGLSIADKQIEAIIQSHLPPSPHLLSVPTDYPYRPEFPYENKNTSAAHLFESWELRKLQYMTLVSHGDRGVGLAQGNWEDEINAQQSPQSLSLTSSTATPNPHKQPKVKMSVAEYKKVRNGEIPMPKASASPPETKKQEDRKQAPRSSQIHSSSQLANEPAKSRLGTDDKRNGAPPASLPKKPEQKPSARDQNGHVPPKTGRPDPREPDKAMLRTNGRVERSKNDLPKSKDNTPARPSSRPDSAQKSREASKPISSSRPSGNIWDTKTNKRPLEASSREPSHPDKRVKTDNGHTRTPSGSRNMTPNKPEAKALPFKPGHSRSTSNLSHASPSQASQPHKKAAPTSNPSDKKSQSSKTSGKLPNSLPPLLSPLPTDIGVSSTGGSGFGFLDSLKSDDHTPPKTPPKKGGADSKSKHDSPSSSPLSTPPMSQSSRNLPAPLSPTLPDVLEQELAKLQQKSATQSTQPTADSINVVPKAAKPKVGHPPKKERQSDPPKSRLGDEKQSMLVKMRYKKRLSRDIERILALKPAPTKDFKILEAQRIAAERQARHPATQPKFDEDSSEEDMPTITSKPSLARKRPIESNDSVPAPKRSKGSDNLDIAKESTPVTPAFRSPGPAGSAQKHILATPKKGDAMKSAIGSVAMRKVESSDGHARTPQAATTSTPASAEKPRITNGETRPEYDKLGLKLKRKMDTILMTKEPPAMRNVSDDQQKLGLCIGLECIAAYMLNAHAHNRSELMAGRPRASVHWEQVIALWGFIDHQCRSRPALYALSTQIGAVCLEQLQGAYIETNDSKIQGNWKKREYQWKSAYSKRNDLPGYGRHPDITELGPWSSVSDATTFTYAVLERYVEKEKDFKWQRER